MIGNLLNILVGLWLAYSAIFANPAGAMNNVALAAGAIAVIVFAVWARQTDPLGWQSGTNIVLAGVLLVLAALVDWRGTARFFLDNLTRWHRHRHCVDVVGALSAGHGADCRVFVK